MVTLPYGPSFYNEKLREAILNSLMIASSNVSSLEEVQNSERGMSWDFSKVRWEKTLVLSLKFSLGRLRLSAHCRRQCISAPPKNRRTCFAHFRSLVLSSRLKIF